jgi:flagella basal body P-ring formation protein FlgA
MQFRNTTITIMLFGLLLASGVVAAQAPERTALRAAVVTREDVVSISDLLPADAPVGMRARAQAITLGDAPLPGAHRTFERALILRSLLEAPELRSALEIPPAVDVTRWSRPLTSDEVANAIRLSLKANDLTGADGLSARDVTINSSIAVTGEAPKLKVTRIEPVPGGSGTRVHLWIASQPRVPPFWVKLDREVEQTTPVASSDAASRSPVRDSSRNREPRPVPINDPPRSARAGDIAGWRARSESRARGMTPAGTLDPVVLIKAGMPVELVVEQSGMRIMTAAIPLSVGRKGDKIRVRSELTGKVLVGTVVGAQTVEVNY